MESLDRYLHEQAQQDVRRRLTAVFCLTAGDAIAGYYTLSAFALVLDEIPPQRRDRLPRYPLIPAFLLGRLAVAMTRQRHGLGTRLLADALDRCLTSPIPGWAVVTDATDDRATAFYRSFGFEAMPSAPARLVLPLASVPK